MEFANSAQQSGSDKLSSKMQKVNIASDQTADEQGSPDSRKRVTSMQLQDWQEHDFKLSKEEVKLGEKLGKGQFSEVYKAQYKGIDIAVKVMAVNDNQLDKYLKKELMVLRRCNHPNLVKYIGACRATVSSVYIATEYLNTGDLRQYLRRPIHIGWKLRAGIVRDVADALKYLHAREIIHRDVKTENVLLDAELKAKLCDFGFARKTDHSIAMTMCGTDEFMAPEIMFGMKYNLSADVFSFGVLLAELVVRKSPGKLGGYLDRKPKDGFEVKADELTAHLKSMSPPPPDSLVNLCIECLRTTPNERPTAEHIHDWLDDMFAELPDDSEDNNNFKPVSEPKPVTPRDNNARDSGKIEDPNTLKDVEKAMATMPITMRGMVTKRGGRIKTWKKRFMVLSSEGLVYHASEKDYVHHLAPNGAILFTDMIQLAGHVSDSVPDVVTSRPHSFRVHTKNRIFFISAPSKELKQEWVKSINEGYTRFLAR